MQAVWLLKIESIMKEIFVLSFVGLIFLSGCSLRQREIELDRRSAELNVKEQQLALKEQTLEFKEQRLNERTKILDSTTKKIGIDSLLMLHPQLPGTWQVRMECVETNCTGSAVGDVKVEQWEFKFQDNSVLASATSNNRLVRVYSGEYQNNLLRLTATQDSSSEPVARMLVRLQGAKDNEMSGEREIIQPNGCRILYALQLKKATGNTLNL